MGCCNSSSSDIDRRIYHIRIDRYVAISQDEIDKIKNDFDKAFRNAGIDATVVITGDYVLVERVL